MSRSQVAALLVRKPWGLKRAELADLDDWYVVNVLLRPGDESHAKDGVYYPVANEDREDGGAGGAGPLGGRQLKAGNFRDMYLDLWQGWGDTPAEAEARWQAWLRANPGVTGWEPTEAASEVASEGADDGGRTRSGDEAEAQGRV